MDTNDFTVLLGNGDGTFRASTVVSGFGSIAFVTADFNGDGITDIATFTSVYLGNGDGTFQAPIPYKLAAGDYDLTSLAVGDFNGDGQVDLAWSASLNGQQGGVIGILPGNGDGTFQASIDTSVVNGGYLVVGDFNGDGRADLAATYGANGPYNTFTVLLGNGDCTFQKPVQYTLGANPEMLAVGDFNGDGRDDLAVGSNVIGSQTGVMSILLSNPDGAFQPGVNYPQTGSLGSLAIGDFNGDGRIDVAAVIGQSVNVLLGNGDGSLQNPVVEASGRYSQLAAADFNGDGRPDLAFLFFTNTNDGIEVLLGNAAPQGPVAITSVLNAASFQPGNEAGSWVAIQGSNMANATRVWQASDFIGNDLPTVVSGVSVTINGNPAFVEYISPTQINVQAPSDNAVGPVNVVVTNGGVASPPAVAQLQAVAPAFFMGPGNSVSASILPNYTPVSATAPAHPGDLVVLWGTGFGATNPPAPAGRVVSGAPVTSTLPVVTAGGIQVPIVSSVLTPGTVGLYQITIQLPTNMPTGAVAVQASVGGTRTQSGVTLLVGAQ
jgi:uncharacterized protein (TIGR03437 family)